ncbi:tape measure protein [Gordonia Phage JonJames]|nr:tape measure protein [Gordonia Phage JonJames]
MADKRYQAGTAWIKVSPDFRGWTKEVKDQVNDSLNNLQARASLDKSSARATRRDLDKALEGVEANVGVALSKRELKAAKKDLDGIAGKHRRIAIVQAELDDARARKQLREMGNDFGKMVLSPKVQLDPKSISKEFDRLQNQIAKRANAGMVLPPKVTRDVLDSALRADLLNKKLADARKEVEKIEKGRDKIRKALNADRDQGKYSFGEVRRMIEDELKLERALKKARLEFDRAIKSQVAANNTLARSEAQMIRSLKNESARVRKPKRADSIIAQPGDQANFSDRVRQRRESSAGKSSLKEDVVAFKNAADFAQKLDREIAKLEASEVSLAHANRTVIETQNRLNEVIEKGISTSKQGVAANIAHTRAVQQLERAAVAKDNQELVTTRMREDYNETAKVLQERLDTNPISRWTQQLELASSRSITAFTNRLVYAGRVVSSFVVLSSAAGAALGTLGLINLGPLVGTLGQVAGALGILPGLAVAAGTAIGAIALGVSGIGGAFKSATKLSDAMAAAGGPGQSADNSKAVRNAQRGVAQANKAAARTAANGAKQIADAERGVQDAQKSSQRAQKDLTQARKDAAEQNEELKESIRDMALEEEDAALSVQEARERLGEVLRDPDSTGTQRRRANLSYRQALEAQRDLRREHQKTKTEFADAQKKGIEGSDVVVAAQERVAEAAEGVAEAQRGVAEAQQNAAESNADAQERVAEAQEALSEAMTTSAAGGSAAQKALEEYERELAKLHPQARALVKQVLGMKDAWMDVRNSVQGRLFGGVATDIQELATKQLPLLQKGLGETAEGINVGLRAALDYLKGSKATADFTSIFDNSAEGVEHFSVGLTNLLRALVPVAEVGTRFMPWFGRSIRDTTNDWRIMAEAAQADGSMEDYFIKAITRAQQYGRILRDLGGGAVAIFASVTGLGEDTLNRTEVRIAAWRERLETELGGEGVVNWFTKVRDLFSTILEITGDVAAFIIAHVVPAFSAITDVVAPIVGGVVHLTTAFADMFPIVQHLLTLFLALRIVDTVIGVGRGAVVRMNAALATQTTAMTTMRTAWNQATVGVNGYTGALARAHIMQQRLAMSPNPMLRQVGQYGAMTRAVGGATAALGGLRAAGSSLVGFLGGPWGVAILAVIAGLGMWYSATQKTKQETQELEERTKRLTKAHKDYNRAVVESRGRRDPQVMSAAEAIATERIDQVDSDADDKVGFTDRFGDLFTKEYWSTDTFFGDDMQSKNIEKKEQEHALAEKQKQLLKDLKIDAAEVGRALAGTDEDWVTFRNRLTASGEAGRDLAATLDADRVAMSEQARVIEQLDAGYLDLHDALSVLRDTQADATDKATALRQAFDALIPGNEKMEALSKFGETMKSLRDAIASVDPEGGFGDELIGAGGQLRTTFANANTLLQLIKDGQQSIAEAQMAGATTEEVTQMWDDWRGSVLQFADAVQIPRDRMELLLKQFAATPEAVSTVINIEGAGNAAATLDEIKLKMDTLFAQGKEGKGTFAIDERMRNTLREMGAGVRDINDVYAEVTFTNDGVYQSFLKLQQAVQGTNTDLDWLASKVQGMPAGKKIIIEDNSPATVARLDALGFKVKTLPDGRIVAIAETETAQTALRALEVSRSTTITANVVKGSGWEHIHDMMLLTENPEEWKRRHQQRQQNQQMPGWGGPWFNNKPPGGYRGMRLPGFANGSRMPGTGPGTEKRDGIYAVLPGGMPIAMVNGSEWVINDKSSEKYDWLLNLINQDRLPGFAVGGPMGGGPKKKQPGLGAIGDPFSAMAGGVMGLGDAFGTAIGTAIPQWQQFGTTLASTTSNFITPALTGVHSQISTLGSLLPTITQSQILPPWMNMATQMANAKATYIDPAFQGITSNLTNLSARVPAMAGIVSPTWQSMATQIMGAKTGTIDPAFQGIQGGLGNVQSSFATAVPNIASQWNGMREATAAPVRFTINTVFNDGLVGMWNSVADIIGGKKMNPYAAKFARGGVLPGYTPGRDVHKFISPTGGELHLSGGEAIMRPEWTRAVGGPAAVDRMNREARGGKGPGSTKLGEMHRANGGAVSVGYGMPAGTNISYGGPGFPMWVYKLAQSYGVQASTYAGHQEDNRGEAGYAPNPQGLNRGIDWSGPVPAMQGFAQYLLGIAPRTPALEQIIWMNPSTGQRIGWAGRSPDISGAYYASDYGGHQDHVHTRQSGPLLPGMAGMAGALMGMAGMGAMDIGAMVRGQMDPKAEEIRKKIKGTPFAGMVGQLPSQVFESAYKSMSKKAVDMAEKSGLFSGTVAPGGGVERWRPMVIAALKRQGFDPSRRNQDLMLAQIQSESGGNPTAINLVDSNAMAGMPSQGLLQTIPPTFQTHRDPLIPGGITDPWANMNAALRYYKATYGNDLGARWGKGMGYDQGGIFPHKTLGFNMSGKPEAVFTNRQWKLLDQLVGALLKPKMFDNLTNEAALGVQPKQAPDTKVITMPEEPKDEEKKDDEAGADDPTSAAGAPAREYTPAKLNPETGSPYETDPETGVPIDPATKKPFTVDPVTKKPITAGDDGLFIDPETGKPFYGSKAEILDQRATTTSPEDTFTFDNPADELGVPEGDWVDEYSGPLSDVFKKGKLLGQLGTALAQPGAIQRIGNDKLMNEQIAAARKREDDLANYKTDTAAKINELRATGKTAEAAALEKEARNKIAGMSEMPGTAKGTQAMLATMTDNPGEDFRRKSADEWKKWLGENWAGIAESAVAGGMGVAQQGAGQAQVIVQGGIHTTNWTAARRDLERRTARQSRANARVGRR